MSSPTNPNPQTAKILSALGYSCRALGRTLGLPSKRWSNILFVGTRPTEAEARLVANYVGLPILELFADDQVIWEQTNAGPSRSEIARSVAV